MGREKLNHKITGDYDCTCAYDSLATLLLIVRATLVCEV